MNIEKIFKGDFVVVSSHLFLNSIALSILLMIWLFSILFFLMWGVLGIFLWFIFPFIIWFVVNRVYRSKKMINLLHPMSYFIYGSLYVFLFQIFARFSENILLASFSGLLSITTIISTIYLGIRSINHLTASQEHQQKNEPIKKEEQIITLPLLDKWLEQEKLKTPLMNLYRQIQNDADLSYEFKEKIRNLEYRFFSECYNQLPPPALSYEYRQIVLSLNNSIQQQLPHNYFETDFKDTRSFFRELHNHLNTRHLEHE